MRVEFRHIDKHFGPVHANRDVSFVITAGSIHGLLGENGAGKSTLVKILSGFIRSEGGQIFLNDRPVTLRTPAEAIRSGIGMLHQDPLDFPSLSVLENFSAGQAGGLLINRCQSVHRFRRLAAEFNFNLPEEEWVRNLTVGERQQLEILRLLSLGVEALILDEPTTGISASQKEALFAALNRLAAQGKSIIFVSHKLEDVEELCQRVTVMRQGQVVGHAEIPCPANHLVEMMFGKSLALPSKPAMGPVDIAVQLQGVVLKDDRFQLQIPPLLMGRGEVIGLAGLEGSGQTVLLQCCAGLLRAQQGSIQINQVDLTRQPYREYLAQGVTYVPADRLQQGLIPGLSIREHVALRCVSAGAVPQQGLIDWVATQATTQLAIDSFKIRGQALTPVEWLSGGNQQRTQLALLPAVLTILLMEHPTRGLDIESAHWIWQQLLARCQNGTAILFASSDLDEILHYSDRIMVFSGGKVSAPLPTSSLTVTQLGRLIGGKFDDEVPSLSRA